MSEVSSSYPKAKESSTPGFFEYRQNNSGGSFDINEDVTLYVVIEAGSASEANDRAESVGVYFDGCDTGSDCSCCGDRWSEAWSDEPDYKTLEEVRTAFSGDQIESWRNRDSWASVNQPYGHVYLLDGKKVSFIKDA